ncbi:MAG: T9SS type A sorting domain-containing protein [Candidatus Firestonebacteria bacterium]
MRLTVLLFLFTGTLWCAPGSSSYSVYLEEACSARPLSISGSNYSVSGALGTGLEATPFSAHYGVKTGYCQTLGIDIIEPDPVKDLTAEALDSGDIKLNWTASSDAESWIKSYRVYRSTVQGVFGNFTAETAGTEFTDNSGLVFGVRYYYVVKPSDIAGNETEENNSTVSALSKSLSTSVKSLSAKPLQGGSIELVWDIISGSAFYRVYRSETEGVKGMKVSLDNTVTGGAFTDTSSNGLTNGKRYFYTAQFVDIYGNEQQKGNAQAAAPSDGEAPSVPVISNSSHPEGAVSDNSAPIFAWLESVDPNSSTYGASGTAGYRCLLSRSAPEAFSKGWAFVKDKKTSFSGLEDGEWYFYLAGEDVAGNFSLPVKYRFLIKTGGTVSGQAADREGNTALKLVRVELLKDGKAAAFMVTGLNGEYSFSKVPFGRYSLLIFKPGFAPFKTAEFELSKNSSELSSQSLVSASRVLTRGEIMAYPNPARAGAVTFVYELETPSTVTIEIYDSAGKRAGSAEDRHSVAGFRETRKDITELSTGVYLYSIKLKDDSGKITRLPLRKFSVVKE